MITLVLVFMLLWLSFKSPLPKIKALPKMAWLSQLWWASLAMGVGVIISFGLSFFME